MLVVKSTSSDKRPLSSSSYDSDSADDLSHQSCGSPTKSKRYHINNRYNVTLKHSRTASDVEEKS